MKVAKSIFKIPPTETLGISWESAEGCTLLGGLGETWGCGRRLPAEVKTGQRQKVRGKLLLMRTIYLRDKGKEKNDFQTRFLLKLIILIKKDSLLTSTFTEHLFRLDSHKIYIFTCFLFTRGKASSPPTLTHLF